VPSASECRRQAKACSKLAKTAISKESRTKLIATAARWRVLAEEAMEHEINKGKSADALPA
jgi:hypothetical protein